MTDSLDFDAWLAGASLAQTSVEVLQKPSLLSAFEDWERRYERAKTAPASAERSMSDPDPIGALEAEGEALLAQIEASLTIWHLRALTSEDVEAILAAHPLPTEPRFTGTLPSGQQNPTEAQAKAYLGMLDSYRLQREAWEAENADRIAEHRKAAAAVLLARGAEKIARAVVRIEQGGSVVSERVTAEQALKLPRQIGEAQVSAIMAAIDRAGDLPEVPAGFLSESSGPGLE